MINQTTNETKVTFSFTPTFNITPAPVNEAQPNTTNSNVRKASQYQIKYYLDLCKQKDVTPKDPLSMSYDELDIEIKTVRNFYPATTSQINLIREKAKLLMDGGFDLNPIMMKYDVTKLTGGREGTASKLINELFDAERKWNETQPPTDKQIEYLTTMYLCPDIPFEEYKIPLFYQSTDGYKRRLDPIEFAMEIYDKMKRHEADKFIKQHGNEFEQWKKSRAKIGQVNRIRELERRQMRIGAPPAVEWAVGLFGEMEVKPPVPVNKSKGYNPKAFEPLSEQDLMQFSEKEASAYIKMLEDSLFDKDLTRFVPEEPLSLTFEELRKIKTNKERVEHEFEEIKNIMFALEAIQGYPDEELHEAISSLLVDSEYSNERLFNAKSRIKDTMLSLIDTKAISFEGMAELCKGSSVAIRCLIGRF